MHWVKHGMEWNGLEWNGMDWNGIDCYYFLSLHSLLSNRPVCALISHVGPVRNRDWSEFQDGGQLHHICVRIQKRKRHTLVR